MALFAKGQRVTVTNCSPSGSGTVHDVYGGPVDIQYRVLMDQVGDDGIKTMAMTRDADMAAAPPIEPYVVGQRVTYRARGAVITDVEESGDPTDPRNDRVFVLCDRDPPELWSGVEHETIIILPAWQLFAYTK